jgi:cysteinyl-tRNA synthetase
MALQFYNSIKRKRNIFSPIIDGEVKLYTCGPTVYNYAHIGNFRTFMFEDLLRRYLEFKGFTVTHVMNLTDVDDKTIRNSQQAGTPLLKFVQFFKDAFFADLDALNIRRAHHYPAATAYVPQMIEMVKTLVDKNYAYVSDDGSVFFDIAKFPEYGRLANLKPEDMLVGNRVADDEYDKEEMRDFALWKGRKAEDGEIFWDSPWGKGRPGWHIECSVMSTELLGDHFDIHCGGIDNLFPHHENEIAQSVCATGKEFVNYWLHSEYLLVDRKKMSKSDHNYFTIPDLLERNIPASIIRWMLLTTHYRQKLNFSLDRVEEAQKSLDRIMSFKNRLKEYQGIEGNAEPFLDDSMKSFELSMDDDLNISGGLGAIFEMIRNGNRLMDMNEFSQEGKLLAMSLIERFDSVLGIFDLLENEATLSLVNDTSWIEAKIIERNKARKAKDYDMSDALRNEIIEAGYELIDKPDETIWKKRTI